MTATLPATGSAPPVPDRRAVAGALLVTAVVAFLAAVAGIGARATYGARVTADEPYYLLTAQSIAGDGDLDISDEIAERAYLPYHEVMVDRQTAVLDDGREVSPHDPLLPTILAPPMAVGGWMLAKITLAAIASAAAALGTWIAIRRFAVGPGTAALVTASAFAGLPLAGYGIQVYPEMAAAVATLAGFAALTPDVLGRRHPIVAGAAIVALPWLAVKYVPIAAVLAIGLLVRLATGRARLTAAGALGMAALAYLLAHRWWYGGWTVYAAGDHFEQTGEFSAVGTQVDLWGRSRRIVGLLVDRDFGLAAWSPIWLLLPIAIVVVDRGRPRGWGLWTALVATGWLTATFVALTMHGWWVPGRQVVVVLPLAVIGIARLVQTWRLQWVTAVAGLLGAVNWVWLAVEASTGRRTLVVDFMDTAAVPHRIWREALPSGLADRPNDRWLLAMWAAAVAASMTWAVVRLRRRATTR